MAERVRPRRLTNVSLQSWAVTRGQRRSVTTLAQLHQHLSVDGLRVDGLSGFKLTFQLYAAGSCQP